MSHSGGSRKSWLPHVSRYGRRGERDSWCMKKPILLAGTLLLTCCSPRDFLSRRLAADLVAASDAFRTPQSLVLQTGIISSKDYFAPESLLLQRRGWISASNTPCPAGLTPAPCWEILLTPSGVETVRLLVPAEDAGKPTFTVPAARRELIAITGISKQGHTAEVEFTWKWVPLNEIGAVFYSSDPHYKSTVAFRYYDDGWHVLSTPHANQTLDEALRNSEESP